MALSNAQRAKIEAEAKRRGVDPAKLIAAAERELAGAGDQEPKPGTPPPAAVAAATDRPLYQYHLPFVTVNEVRTKWLGLEPLPGGEVNAAKYAAEQLAGAATAPAKPEEPKP